MESKNRKDRKNQRLGDNFGTLYRYELKKILGKRIVRIAMLIMLVLAPAGLAVSAAFQPDGGARNAYENGRQMRERESALNGQPMDEAFFELVHAGWHQAPIDETFRTYYNILREQGLDPGTASAEQFYGALDFDFSRMRDNAGLTESERDYWTREWESLERPYTFGYVVGMESMCDTLYSASVFAIIFLAICLASVFAEEHQRRTDAILLCSVYGRSRLYLVKFLAGLTFGLSSTAVMMLELAGVMGAIYGFGGGEFQIQARVTYSPYHWTFGQLFLASYGNALLSMLVVSALVLMLSELLRSAVASMSVVVGLLLASMTFEMPENVRFLAQIWEYFPGRNLGLWQVYNLYTISLGGLRLNFYASCAALYLILTGIFFLAGKRRYQRFQVGGR